MFDLDDFKQINDRMGHQTGNAALAGVAERMREVLRSADIAARYGGDEFAVILPESGVEEAEKFYERLRAHIAASPIPSVGVMGLSCGVGELESQEDWKTFFNRVDDALFRAKRAGKGQVVPRSAASGSSRRKASARPSPTSTIRTTDRRTTASRATGRSNAEGPVRAPSIVSSFGSAGLLAVEGRVDLGHFLGLAGVVRAHRLGARLAAEVDPERRQVDAGRAVADLLEAASTASRW